MSGGNGHLQTEILLLENKQLRAKLAAMEEKKNIYMVIVGFMLTNVSKVKRGFFPLADLQAFDVAHRITAQPGTITPKAVEGEPAKEPEPALVLEVLARDGGQDGGEAPAGDPAPPEAQRRLVALP